MLSRTSRRAGSNQAALAVALLVALAACRTPAQPEPEKQTEKNVALLAAEGERLQFVLPADFVAVELRGEGSETLRAPAGAGVRALPGGVAIEAGTEFALDVELQSQRSQLPAAAPGARRVMQESDLVVFESAGGYWFMMLRELVPEWDESERRRVACSSAGAAREGTPPRVFPRSAVERMVAACRSLALPRLD